jgi:hypothetical protein
MQNETLIDMRDDYNQALRLRRIKRAFAATGATLFALMAGVGMGMLLCTVTRPLAMLVVAVAIWGAIGLAYLVTRH